MENRTRSKKRWTEEEARGHIKAWKDSGLSMSEYARRQDVSMWRLRRWKEKQKLEGADAKTASSEREPARGPAQGSTRPPAVRKRKGSSPGERGDEGPARDFVEVEVSSPRLRSSGDRGLALCAPGGYRVEVPVGFDVPTLKQVLTVLQEVR